MLAEPLLKTKKEFKDLKKQETNYIYKNELDKASFQHDMAYGGLKDLARRTASEKVLRDKAFNIAKNSKYDGYQKVLAPMVYKSFDKKSAGSGVNNEHPLYLATPQKLAEELDKPIIRNFIKRTVYSGFRDNIWGC